MQDVGLKQSKELREQPGQGISSYTGPCATSTVRPVLEYQLARIHRRWTVCTEACQALWRPAEAGRLQIEQFLAHSHINCVVAAYSLSVGR